MVRGPIDFEKLEREGVPFASLPAGEKVFLQDEAGGTMYLVRSGMIDILMYGRVLETVGANGIFGLVVGQCVSARPDSISHR